jgi:hypothetical protein
VVGSLDGSVHHDVLVFICVFLAQIGDTQPLSEARVNRVLVIGSGILVPRNSLLSMLRPSSKIALSGYGIRQYR